jgi:lysophospholipase L1-like esterase
MRLLVFCDSNACRPANGKDCWPAILQRLGDNTLLVINESCDGRTTRHDTGECNGLKIIKKKIMYSLPLNGVMLALGTNDVKFKYGFPNPVEVVAGIDQMVRIIKKVDSCIQPLLLTPPPLGNVTSGDLAGSQGRIPPLVAEYRRYATSNKIPIIDLFLAVDTAVDLEPDGVHLNSRGRNKVAGYVWKNIQKIHSLFVHPL